MLARLAGPSTPVRNPRLRVVLASPPLKGDRMELVIQKATELGVAEIWPVVTARTDAAARPALQGSRQERWEKVASGAAEQCGRRRARRRGHGHADELLQRPFDGARLVLVEDGRPAPARGRPRPPCCA